MDQNTKKKQQVCLIFSDATDIHRIASFLAHSAIFFTSNTRMATNIFFLMQAGLDINRLTFDSAC